MKAWERLCATRGVSKRQARQQAHALADRANAMGMFSSDSLELLISATETSERGLDRGEWIERLRSDTIVNRANGLSLNWMLDQFTEEELVAVASQGW